VSVLAEYVYFRRACLFTRRVCLQGVFVYKACLFTRRAYLSFAKHAKARGIARSARFSTLCSLSGANGRRSAAVDTVGMFGETKISPRKIFLLMYASLCAALCTT
jgi:hypothetical protein